MPGLQEVRNALALQIQNNAYPKLQAYGDAPDTINAPCAVVVPTRGKFATYEMTLGSDYMGFGMPTPVPTATGFMLDVEVVVARTDLDRTQQALDQWFGYENVEGVTVSIPMAVAMDSSLGGLVRWCNPLTADSYGPVNWNGVDYFGARIHFDIALV